MEFSIENSDGKVYIGMNELGSYLFYDTALSSTWYCGGGTLAKFLCTSESGETQIKQLKAIQSNLYNDYSNQIDELKEMLHPLINTLRSGNYHISFVQGEEWRINPGARTPNWDIYLHPRNFQPSTGYGIAYNFYDKLDLKFIGTETEAAIHPETVKRYEKEIQEGKRPFAIILSSYYQPEADPFYPFEELGGYEADWDSEYFILDGHHKLLAYRNLGIAPNFVHIQQRFKQMKDTYFDFNEFSSILSQDQKMHFKNNWKSAHKYKNGKRSRY